MNRRRILACMSVVTALLVVQVAPAFADSPSSPAPTNQAAPADPGTTASPGASSPASADAPPTDAAPASDTPTSDAPHGQAPKAGAAKDEAAKAEGAKAEGAKDEAAKDEAAKDEAAKAEVSPAQAPSGEAATGSTAESTAAGSAPVSSSLTRSSSVVGSPEVAVQVMADDADPEAPLTVTVSGTVVDVNATGRTDAGDAVDLVATVTVTGSDTVQSATVTTGGGVTFDCPAGDLAPGAELHCTARLPLAQADVDAGHLDVVVTASGTVLGTGSAVSSEPVTSSTAVTAPAGLSVTQKITQRSDRDKDGRIDAGDQVDVRVSVRNSGALTLTGLAVSDALLSRLGVALTCSTAHLAPGATSTCTSARFAVTTAQARTGSLRNQATAKATSLGGLVVTSNTSTATVRLQVPSTTTTTSSKRSTASTTVARLRVTQWVARVLDHDQDGTIDAGDVITFAFRATNTGTVTVRDLRVVDRRLSRMGVGVYCPVTTLAPGVSVVCTSGPVVVTKFQAAKGFGRNFAYVTGRAPGGALVRSNSSVTTVGTTVRSVSASASSLPRTGTDPREPVLLGLVLLLVGATMTLLSRRCARPRGRVLPVTVPGRPG